MSIVRVLVLLHLSLTGALLLLFAAVVACQRLVAAARPSAAATPLPYPSDAPAEPVVVPVQEGSPRRTSTASAASVLEWTVDLRAEAASAQAAEAAGRRALQPSS